MNTFPEDCVGAILKTLDVLQPSIKIEPVPFSDGRLIEYGGDNTFYSKFVARIPMLTICEQYGNSSFKFDDLWPASFSMGIRNTSISFSSSDHFAIAHFSVYYPADFKKFSAIWIAGLERELERIFYSSVESVLSKD